MSKDKRALVQHLTRFGLILCKVSLMWGHLKALDLVCLIAVNLISLTVVKLINLSSLILLFQLVTGLQVISLELVAWNITVYKLSQLVFLNLKALTITCTMEQYLG